MKDDQFDKIFNYLQKMDKRLQYVEENMATKSSIDRLINTMDSFIAQLSDSESEQAARDAQFARLLDWARKVSAKTGIPLEGF